MRFGELKSIAHNFADSISSGIGLPIGIYGYDIFGEAQASAGGYIEIDFIASRIYGGATSRVLTDALREYKNWLPTLTAKHGAEVSAFTQLTIRFAVDVVKGPYFTVSMSDTKGRSDKSTYSGYGGRTLVKARAR
jgi:hypothetical protein